jgi:hypothetical protein
LEICIKIVYSPGDFRKAMCLHAALEKTLENNFSKRVLKISENSEAF